MKRIIAGLVRRYEARSSRLKAQREEGLAAVVSDGRRLMNPVMELPGRKAVNFVSIGEALPGRFVIVVPVCMN